MTRRSSNLIFLSASVPLPSRNPIYFRTADVIAIRDSVRALVMVILERNEKLVFGGHPAITPMIRQQVLQSRQSVGDIVIIYQSRFFERSFPEDNRTFERIVLVDAVRGDRQASLEALRRAMLSQRFQAGIFGGMEGVEDEYCMFRDMHPKTPAFPIASTGAAAEKIYAADKMLATHYPELASEISYLSLMRKLTAPRARGQR
jgi:SLOG cluster3 family